MKQRAGMQTAGPAGLRLLLLCGLLSSLLYLAMNIVVPLF